MGHAVPLGQMQAPAFGLPPAGMYMQPGPYSQGATQAAGTYLQHAAAPYAAPHPPSMHYAPLSQQHPAAAFSTSTQYAAPIGGTQAGSGSLLPMPQHGTADPAMQHEQQDDGDDPDQSLSPSAPAKDTVGDVKVADPEMDPQHLGGKNWGWDASRFATSGASKVTVDQMKDMLRRRSVVVTAGRPARPLRVPNRRQDLVNLLTGDPLDAVRDIDSKKTCIPKELKLMVLTCAADVEEVWRMLSCACSMHPYTSVFRTHLIWPHHVRAALPHAAHWKVTQTLHWSLNCGVVQYCALCLTDPVRAHETVTQEYKQLLDYVTVKNAAVHAIKKHEVAFIQLAAQCVASWCLILEY